MSSQHQGMRSWSGSLRVLCGLLCVGFAMGAAPVRAQDSPADQSGSSPGAAATQNGNPPSAADPQSTVGKPAASAGTYSFDIRYLEGPDGRPVAVPDKASLDKFLKWFAEQGAPDQPPAGAVASLLFEGSVADDRVHLTAQVEIVVTKETGWVRVPLSMSEATLRDAPVYTGPGLAVPGPLLPDVGYTWWLSGRGTHLLTLPLSVPILKLATQNRVQLSLPTTAARSKLILKIESPRVSAKVPDSSTLKTRTAQQSTEVEVIGLGNRLDLAWQTLPDTPPTETALEVTTTAVATLVDGDAATLEATQRIQSLGQQGTFDELRVSLPAGCELLRLEGREHRDHHFDPANPHQVVVQLKKATSGPIDLKWTVRSKLPAVGESFALEGFEVERARLQTGYLAVVVVGDFRIVPEEDNFLQRIDLADLPGSMRQVPAKASYRFLNRLLLRLKLQRIEPHVTVDPAALLYFSSDSVEFEESFRLQVSRGSIGAFRLRWPAWKAQGWKIIEAELQGNSLAGHVELRPSEEVGDGDVLRLDFLEPVRGTVDLRIRARRSLSSAAEPISLTVPAPETAHPFSTRLAVVSADNVEVELRPSDATVLHPSSEPSGRIPVPREWQSLRRVDYRLESAKSELSASLSVHSRKIQGTSEIEASIRSGAVTVRQKFLFDVSYERIAQLRFSMPEGVAPEQLKVFAAGDRKLPALYVAGNDRAAAELRVTLDTPLIGRFDMEFRFALPGLPPVAGAQAAKVLIPFVQSLDVGISETRFACRDAAGREATVGEVGWRRRLAPEGAPIWTIAGSPAAVELSVAHSASSLNHMQVAKALIRTVVTAGGMIENRAQYRLSEGISELSVALPRDLDATELEFWWNRSELAVAPPVVAADGMLLYEIIIPDRVSTADGLLTIDFRCRARDGGRFGASYSLQMPHLPEDLRIGQVYWQVELPYHEHLFTEPAGYSPDYRWEFGRSLWSREPDMSELDLQQWIGTASGPAPLAVRAGENRYLFGTSGDVPPLAFWALRKWSMTLIGAGTALALGLVLLRWPVTRHAATLLAVAFVIAGLGVWFPGPMTVLLQPAVLGVALAMIAGGINSYQRRRSRPVLLSLGSASGFSVQASSHTRSPAVGVGSNDYTSLRSPADMAHAPGQISSQTSGHLSESSSRL
jgi:hypothetical protein